MMKFTLSILAMVLVCLTSTAIEMEPTTELAVEFTDATEASIDGNLINLDPDVRICTFVQTFLVPLCHAGVKQITKQ